MIRLLLLGLLLPSAAPAATAVVYDPALGEKEVATAWLQQQGRDVDVRYVSVDEVFDPSSPAVLLGDVTPAVCGGEPADRQAFQSVALEVDEAAFGMEYLTASAALDRQTALLPCLNEVPDSAELSHYHFMRGVVAWYAEGPAVATKRFEEALLVTPFLQWERRYPPELRPSFEEAVRSALEAEKALFSVSGGIVEAGTFYVNGLAFDPRARTTNLYEGTHLLQWVPAEGATATWMVEVRGGQFVTLVHRPDAVSALLAGRADAGVTEFAMSRVLAPVEREAVSTVAVAESWDVILFHEYDVANSTWRLADLEAIELWRQTGRNLRLTGVGLMLGGAVAGVLGGVLGGLGANETQRIADRLEPVWQPVEGHEFQQGPYSELSVESTRYVAAQGQIRIGIGLGVVGGALVVAGIPVTITGDRRAKAAGINTRKK